MITDHFTRQSEPAPPCAPAPPPGDPVGLLARIYREAGLPSDVARRCALADFRCSFPHLLTAGL